MWSHLIKIIKLKIDHIHEHPNWSDILSSSQTWFLNRIVSVRFSFKITQIFIWGFHYFPWYSHTFYSLIALAHLTFNCTNNRNDQTFTDFFILSLKCSHYISFQKRETPLFVTLGWHFGDIWLQTLPTVHDKSIHYVWPMNTLCIDGINCNMRAPALFTSTSKLFTKYTLI